MPVFNFTQTQTTLRGKRWGAEDEKGENNSRNFLARPPHARPSSLPLAVRGPGCRTNFSFAQMRALAPRRPTCPARRGRPLATTPRAGQTRRAAPPPSPAVSLAAAPVTAKDTRSQLPPPPELDQLPPSLARSVAVVRRGGVPVYILGVSHVSAVSVEQVREKKEGGWCGGRERGGGKGAREDSTNKPARRWRAAATLTLSTPPAPQTAALISAVAPDAVLVEVCNDRLGLLLPPRDKDAPTPQVWHTSGVRLDGTPSDVDGWPSTDALLSVCRTSPGVPVTTSDIEADCVALQATGLFRSVRPSTTMPRSGAAPAYLATASSSPPMAPAMPLGDVVFATTPRDLPPPTSVAWRLDSGVEAAGATVDAAAADAAAARLATGTDAAAATGKRGAVVGVLAGAAPGLAALVAGVPPGRRARVSYSGIETGRLEIVFKLDGEGEGEGGKSLHASPSLLTGLEESAVGGVGPGIEPFVPYRGPLPLTKTMRVDNLADVLPVETVSVDDVAAAAGGERGGDVATSFVGRWPPPRVPKTGDDDDEEDDEDASSTPSSSSPLTPALDWLACTLTKRYARYQSAAGDKAGVEDGAAWRAALAAADATRTTAAVVVADAPSTRVARKLAARVALAVPVAAAAAVGIVAAAATAIDGGLVEGDAAITAVRAAAVAGVSACVWPFVAPLVEVRSFASKTAAELEALVAPTEPLSITTRSRYWGEDALLGWPGATQPLIDDRDAYMAAVAHAAAGGEALAPAYARDKGGSGPSVWRYAAPAAAAAIKGAAPPRVGEGEYALPPTPRAIVAVVGTAHVPGMRREWERLEAGAVSARALAEGAMKE